MSVIGIDFGTVQSVIAAARNHGIDILCNEVSQRFTPSMVGFGTRNRYIGEGAASHEMSNMRNMVRSLKRLIGLSPNDPAVEIEQQYLTCELCAAGHEVGVRVQYLGEPRVFSATQLCGMYLARLKQLAENELQAPACDVVVSVPPWFTPIQRTAMKDACEIAGLNSLRPINENTAAALVYGITKSDLPDIANPRKVLFLDIGAASTSVSAVAFAKGRLEVKGTAFDKNMGGRNLDAILVDHFAREIKARKGIDVLTLPKPLMRLRAAIEKVKKMLSSNHEAPLNIESLYEDIDINLLLTREQFQTYAASFVSRITPLIDAALQRAGWSPSDVVCVETVGGTTRIPMVREVVLAYFERQDILSFTINQDEAVARGSALMCAIISPKFKVRDFEVKDLASYGFLLAYGAGMTEPTKADSDKVDQTEVAAAAAVPTKSMLVFDSNAVVPSSKMLLFNVSHSTFVFDALLDVSGNSPMAHKSFATAVACNRTSFSVSNIPQPSAGFKLRVRYHPDHTFHVEQALGLVEEIVEVPAEKTDAPAAETEDVANAEGLEERAATPTPAMVTKKVTRKIELTYEMREQGRLDRNAVLAQREEEQKMAANDKLVFDTEVAKNSLEEYIYETRHKVGGAWRRFLTDADAQKLNSLASESEEWIYTEDGETAPKSVYQERRDAMCRIGSPAEILLREAEGVGPSVQGLIGVLEDYGRRFADPAQTHWLPCEELATARAKIEEMRTTTLAQYQEQLALPGTAAPILTCAHIAKQRDEVESASRQLLGRPKPVVPKVVPETQDKVATDAVVDLAVETVATAVDGEKMDTE